MSSKGPTPKKDSARQKATGGSRTTERAKLAVRYTAPTPRSFKRSSKFVPIAMLVCLGLGVLTIILNYISVLPYGTTTGSMLIGLAFILVAIGFATRWR